MQGGDRGVVAVYRYLTTIHLQCTPVAPRAHAFFPTGEGGDLLVALVDVLLAFSYALYHFILCMGSICFSPPHAPSSCAGWASNFFQRDGGGNSFFGFYSLKIFVVCCIRLVAVAPIVSWTLRGQTNNDRKGGYSYWFLVGFTSREVVASYRSWGRLLPLWAVRCRGLEMYYVGAQIGMVKQVGAGGE